MRDHTQPLHDTCAKTVMCPSIDFAVLDGQTLGDVELQIELLDLFVAQARRVLPLLLAPDSIAQNHRAHLLKGSARSIGAGPMAAAAAAFEDADAAGRPPIQAALLAELVRVEAAIAAWLLDRGNGERATIEP